MEIINLIKSRSRGGIDKSGKPFPGYKKSYKESREFKLAGKSSRVNLTFTGEMLNEIELIRHGRGFIVIGFERGTDVNDRAKFTKDWGRDFLGISEKEKNQLIKRVRRFSPDEEREVLEVPTLTQRILERIRGN